MAEATVSVLVCAPCAPESVCDTLGATCDDVEAPAVSAVSGMFISFSSPLKSKQTGEIRTLAHAHTRHAHNYITLLDKLGVLYVGRVTRQAYLAQDRNKHLNSKCS